MRSASPSASSSTSPSASTSSPSSSSEEEEYHLSARTFSPLLFFLFSPVLSFSFLASPAPLFFLMLGKLLILGLEMGVGALLASLSAEGAGEGNRSEAEAEDDGSTLLRSLRFFLLASGGASAEDEERGGRLEREEESEADLARAAETGGEGFLLEVEVEGRAEESFFVGLGLARTFFSFSEAEPTDFFSFFKLSWPFITPPPPAFAGAEPCSFFSFSFVAAFSSTTSASSFPPFGLPPPAELRLVRPVLLDCTWEELPVLTLESAGEADSAAGEVILAVGAVLGGGGGRTGDSAALPALPLREGLVLLLPPLLSEAGTVPLPMRKLLVGALTAGGILAVAEEEGEGLMGTAVRREGGRGGAEDGREMPVPVDGEGARLAVEVESEREREEERE